MGGLVRRVLIHLADTLPWTLLTAVVLAARAAWPPRGLDETGAVALRDLALTILLWAITILLALGLGKRLLAIVAPPDLARAERAVFSLALGLGALGYLIFAFGILGLLRPAWIAGALLGLSLWVGPGLGRLSATLRDSLSGALGAWRRAEPLARMASILAAAIGLLALTHALSPPWDFDGLMYHLVGPRIYLEAGRLFPVQSSFFLNAPSTGEMLFTVGMAFGDDVFPRLLHFTAGALLVAAAHAAGRRWVGPRGGWLSAAALLSVPALPVWAAFAYIDVTWALFEFLAMMAAVMGWSSGSARWLVVAGLMAGLAMGTKYLGLMGFGVIGLFVAATSVARGGWKPLVQSCLAFGVPAVVVAAPWYIKNAVWLGNPVFPLFFGARGWSEGHLELYSAYLDSFGVGRTPMDYLLLPWNVYAQHAVFGATVNRIDVPGLLFPVLLLYPFLKRGRVISALLGISLARGAVWATESQQIRFLLPIYPALAVATAYVADRWRPRFPSRFPWALFLPTLATGFLVITAFFQAVLVFAQVRPIAAIVGAESRRSFLERSVDDFRAVMFAEEMLPPGSRILMIGDSRGYYCTSRCLPPDQFGWANDIAHLEAGEDLGPWLRSLGATHILISIETLDFLLQHDPQGVMEESLRAVLDWRDQGCLGEVYSDRWTRIYEIGCD